jgi:hypothetical protein
MFSRIQHQTRKHQRIGFLLLVLTWSLAMGWLMASITHAQSTTPAEIGTVDAVPQQYQLGQELYLENCTTCHIGIPPAVFPTQTWKDLLQDNQHYGVQIKQLVDPPRILVWRYLSTFSRPKLENEQTPYRFASSRYFKALHPKIKIPKPINASSCVSCHPGANEFNFRRLSGEWQ